MFCDAIERSVKRRADKCTPEKVVVAVKAEKVISRTALAWSLNHVVHHGDCITLLAVLPAESYGKRFWSFPILAGDCASRKEKLPDRIFEISESCSQMVLQFHSQIEVTVRVKVVVGTPSGAVAAEAKGNGANWVILDKKLKQELKLCVNELRCNIVVMKGSQPKVVRLNLACSNGVETPFFSAASSPTMDLGKFMGHKMKYSTPVSSPEEPSTSYMRTTKEGSLSSYDSDASIFLICEQNPLFEGPQQKSFRLEQNESEASLSPIDSYQERVITLSRITRPSTERSQGVFWIPQNENKHRNGRNSRKDTDSRKVEINPIYNKDCITNSNIRDAISLGRTSSVPPPLCSLCQYKTPMFGKPPKQFSYQELEEATEGFSATNYLAESGFGVVHRGVLRDGQVVAVKQLKFGGSQADVDFSREVRVLSCAQHRNVVLLIGYCVEGNARVLVYEYICNSSLDFHLHEKRTPLEWHARLKIATGTARGLRYLHEDCRVGCVVHRDLRPNNILLTHDFEPMVADFGLARWHSEWDMGTNDQAFETSGYVAPENVEGGQVTHEVDVYAFGLVLLELMTGQRVTQLQQSSQNLLADWLNPLTTLEPNKLLPSYYPLIDPGLTGCDQSRDFLPQLEAMGRAASLCLRQDPEARPLMSKVLRVLEGGDALVPRGSDVNSVGSRSFHMHALSSRRKPELRASHSRRLSH